MTRVDWRHVRAADFPVPNVAPLADLTTELTSLLGSPDPELRDELALPTLQTWIRRGVYDHLLAGLGDGIAAGLNNGLGRRDDDSVFRRSRSASVLAACIRRDTAVPLLTGGRVLDWADRLATWLLSERDLRPHAEQKGWVRAISHGADALAAVAGSPHCGRAELSILLDMIGERVTAPARTHWAADEADQLAAATTRLLKRSTLPLDHVELWIATIGDRSYGRRIGHGSPDAVAINTDAFIRAMYLNLALAPDPPAIRANLLLTVVAVLRELHPELLGGQDHSPHRG